MSGLESLLIKARSAARRGDAESARVLYRQVLDRHPRNARAKAGLEALDEPADTPAQVAFDNMVAAFRAGRMEEAARLGARLSASHPQAHGVHNLLGAALLELGRDTEAESAFRRATAADPDGPAAYNNLAIALRRQGRTEDAEAIWRDVISRAPGYGDACYNLAGLLEQGGRLDEAAQWLERAIAIEPGHADAHYNLGNLHASRGNRPAAIACFEAAARLEPGHGDAHNNMGAQFLADHRADEALAAFDRALAADPANTGTMVNRGKALVLKGDRPGAIEAFRAAFARNPCDTGALLQALFEEAHLCDWHARGEYVLTTGPEAAAVQPFASLPFVDDPAHQYQRSVACAARMYPDAPPDMPAPAPSSDGRIRVGYFSGDFHDHATMHLMSGFFREHDRSRFDVRLYSYGPMREQDALRAALRSCVDGFTEIGAMRDEDVVALARADGLDLAVDLKGFTLGTRTRLFGHRLAPVQVSWMGYPGTLGHACMDYFIADHVTMPPGAEAFFTEKIVRLANCYQANDDARPITTDLRGRKGWNLPEDGFVFASFNQSYKISPAEWDIWMGLLREVEGSVLWLLDTGPHVQANLSREARARGVEAERLVFAPPIPHAAHLGRLAHADLFLDTFAVNAHTTASDALWAGLPVLTFAGNQFAARVAASLVHAAGLPELAMGSAADYARLALELARDRPRLATLRARLAERRATCPLFDTAAYTRRIESAFTRMHHRRGCGLAPDHFDVD